MGRWTLLACAIPYATWHDHVEEQKRLKRAAEKVVKRWRHMALSVPFNTWLEHTKELLHQRQVRPAIYATYIGYVYMLSVCVTAGAAGA